MPKQSNKPAALRESWRPDSANAELIENRNRIVQRFLVSALLAVLVGVFGFLLFSPFYHPKLRLFFLTAGSYDVVDLKPIPYFQEAAVRFLSIDGSFQKKDASDEFSIMESPEVVRTFMERIANSKTQKSDVALIHLSAHPMIEAERPFLKCTNFNRETPELGSISIEEILNLLDRVAAGTTVVCLDLGPSNSQRISDLASDEFLFSVRDLVKSRKNPSLWILVSNSPQEGSYASMELHSSVFSYAVTKGLQGAADLNHDASIDLDEFTRYVVGFTQSQVQRESGGNTVQTPVLFSTGGNVAAILNARSIASAPNPGFQFSWSSFVPNFWGDSTSKDDTVQETADKEAEKVQAEKHWLTEYWDRSSTRIRERTIEELEDNINFLPSILGDRVKHAIGLDEEELAESTYNKADGGAVIVGTNAEKDASTENATTTRTEQLSATDPVATFRQPTPDISRLGDPKQSNAQLLQLAWQFCEYLERTQAGVMRPIDFAPHAWSEFTSHLHGIEERLRTDSIADPKNLRLKLTSEIIGNYQFAMTGRAQVGTLSKRIATQMPDLGLPKSALPSVAMMESLSQFGGSTVPNSLAGQIQQLDAAIQNETPDLFDRWFAQVPTELPAQYVEFYWPQQLVSRQSTPWKITRRVAGLWRQYEQISYDPLNSNLSIQQELVLTQQFLLEGTRLALDQIGVDWIDRCLRTLDRAELALRAASEKRNQLRLALQSRNQRMAELPSILRWRKIAATQLGNYQLDEDVDKALSSLGKLCESLLRREQCDLGEVVRNRAHLELCIERIQTYWIEESNRLLNGSSNPAVSPNWIADSLLATPLIRNQLRNRLIVLPVSNRPQMDAEIELNSRLPSLANSRIPNKGMEQQIRFELMAAHIAGMSSDSLAAGLEPAQTADAIDRFYGDLVKQISETFGKIKSATTAEDLPVLLHQLRLADQSLRLLPPANSHLFDGKPLQSKLWQAEFLQCVQNKLHVTQKCFLDASSEEVQFLNNGNERLAFLANFLSGAQQNFPQQSPRLSVGGTSSISLMAEPQSSGEVVLKNVGKSIGNAWVLVDFDPTILELQGPPGVQLNPVWALPQKIDDIRRKADQELLVAIAVGSQSPDGPRGIDEARNRHALRTELVYPVKPVTGMVAPTMGLAAGQVVTLPFKVRRIGLGPSQAKLVWKLVGGDEYVRHEVVIQLPESEKLRILADGPANSWVPTHEGLALYPWPNRSTEYRFGLKNDSGKPRTLSVDLIALMTRRDVTLPEGFLTSAVSQEIADILGPTKLVAVIPEVTLDGKSETIWLQLQPLLDRIDVSSVATPKESPATPTPTGQGLVLVLTDKATNQKYWRRIETRVRHPRSYIEPTVSFDAASERIDIRLKSTQAESVPANGIKVVGRILEPLPRGTEMKLEGTILAGEIASLHCQVPMISSRELTFELDIDGFPRVFVIKVPCWRSNADIPVVSDFQRIEIVDPIEGLNIGPNDKSQRVRLKIDAIPGSFETKRDYVEVGWDVDRDREFAEETTLKFAADRQVDVVVNSIASGRVSLTANVSDISFDLPPPSLKNERVNLLAKLSAGGEMVWSKPVEVVVDSDPPTVTGVEIMPSTTFSLGIDLMVRVGVDDAKLSGIASVELLIDTKGIGMFTEAAGVPKACDRQSDGSWTIKLPTTDLQPGRASLLVRATDRVGNKSEVSKTVLSIISEQEWQDRLKLAVQELSGSVIYSDSPLPNAKVTLEDEKGAIVQRTTTDARGMFRLPNVQVGKYNIVAIGVLKNRPRKSEQIVEISAPPSPPPRLRLIAK